MAREDEQVVDEIADGELIALAVEIFAMLADPTRVKIILTLTNGESSVNNLAVVVDKSPAAVSQHLAKLRLARILLTRQEGNRVYYRLANEHVAQLVTDAVHQAEHSIGHPRHHARPAARTAQRLGAGGAPGTDRDHRQRP